MQGLILFLLLLCCAPGWAQTADVKQDLMDNSARRDEVRQRIAGLQAEMDQARGKQAELNNQLAATELEIGALAQSMDKLDQQGAGLSAELARLHHQLAQEQTAQQQEQELLRRQLRSAYMVGRQERLKILLNQEDPTLLSRSLSYYDYVNRARAVRMQEIQQRIDRLAVLESEIRTRESELEQLKLQRLAEKQELEKTQAARQQIVAQLDQELHQGGAALQQLKQDEARLNSLLEGIQQLLSDLDNPQQLPFRQLKGKLPWPTNGHIKASFGSPKIGSLRWDGVIIKAPEGRKFHAVHAGRVAYADWLRGYGLLLIIDHGEGYMSLYGHNQSLFKETGDWVETGDVLGLVGSSGAQSATGIYFGIRHDGKAVNPARWCKKGRGNRVG